MGPNKREPTQQNERWKSRCLLSKELLNYCAASYKWKRIPRQHWYSSVLHKHPKSSCWKLQHPPVPNRLRLLNNCRMKTCSSLEHQYKPAQMVLKAHKCVDEFQTWNMR